MNYKYDPELLIYPFKNEERDERVNKPNSHAEEFFLEPSFDWFVR